MNICLPRKPVKGLACRGKSLCQKHLVRFTDINYMLERALAGDSSVYRRGSFLDVSNIPDSMQEVLNKQIVAKNAYESLPAKVRERFPTAESFVSACFNPEIAKDLQSLGLTNPVSSREPVEVKIINPVTPEVSKDPTSAACA